VVLLLKFFVRIDVKKIKDIKQFDDHFGKLDILNYD